VRRCRIYREMCIGKNEIISLNDRSLFTLLKLVGKGIWIRKNEIISLNDQLMNFCLLWLKLISIIVFA
jgi:hypothetical protein